MTTEETNALILINNRVFSMFLQVSILLCVNFWFNVACASWLHHCWGGRTKLVVIKCLDGSVDESVQQQEISKILLATKRLTLWDGGLWVRQQCDFLRSPLGDGKQRPSVWKAPGQRDEVKRRWWRWWKKAKKNGQDEREPEEMYAVAWKKKKRWDKKKRCKRLLT